MLSWELLRLTSVIWAPLTIFDSEQGLERLLLIESAFCEYLNKFDINGYLPNILELSIFS